MFYLTSEEQNAIAFILEQNIVSVRQESLLSDAMETRLLYARMAIEFCYNTGKLPYKKNQMMVVVDVLYDFLVIETMNQVRGLLSSKSLKQLETLRTLFAKILANAQVRGRELNIGSIYVVPAEMVKIGLHKMLERSEMQLLGYAWKNDGGMLGVIARFFWHQDYEKHGEKTVH